MADESGEIMEGHLCPICTIDLGSIPKLHAHFQEEHSDDINIKKFLKGMAANVRKIMKQNTETDESIRQRRKDVIYNLDIYNKPQSLGATRSHFEAFREIRNNRVEGLSSETNKLIIRLDKLINNAPSDLSRRKLHEQTVVPWVDGEDVSRCPECTKSFNWTRRQHHCRLCGSVMCNDCSFFLSLVKAKHILSQGVEENGISEDDNEENSLRVCQYCTKLLESRESMQASRNCNPLITQLYDQIRSYLAELDKDIELYTEMSLSLNDGRSTYNLNDAKELWDKIIRHSEKVGLISGKIASLGMNDPKKIPTDKELKLQKSISIGVNGYIQSKILTLLALPSEEIYKKLQEERRRRIEQEIRERKLEEITDSLLSSQIRTEFVHCKPISDKLQKDVTLDDGWIPDATGMYHNDDPIIEQMNNIRSYIKQAREAYKFDEVASLEKNLRELQEEFYRQQQSC
ncbi:rabenosyn-5 [Planococcus citri]|uniref:rabenosyn-5 n=1 Tax=Planococcus citri TaxID=170843 RepID=UPI0031F7C10A